MGSGFHFCVDLVLVLECHRNRELFRREVTSGGLLVCSPTHSRAVCLVDDIVSRCDCAEETAFTFLV